MSVYILMPVARLSYGEVGIELIVSALPCRPVQGLYRRTGTPSLSVFISRPACRACVRACVRVCVRACVCHAVSSETTTVTHFW